MIINAEMHNLFTNFVQLDDFYLFKFSFLCCFCSCGFSVSSAISNSMFFQFHNLFILYLILNFRNALTQ